MEPNGSAYPRCAKVEGKERCGAPRGALIHAVSARGAWYEGWGPFTGHAFIPPKWAQP